jgi:hypothetical protein
MTHHFLGVHPREIAFQHIGFDSVSELPEAFTTWGAVK